MHIERINSRLKGLRKALDAAKEQDKFDACLRLEGQMLAYKSIYMDLLSEGKKPAIVCDICGSEIEDGDPVVCMNCSGSATSDGEYHFEWVDATNGIVRLTRCR